MEREYGIKELADILEVSYATALHYVKKYMPGAIRRGGRWFVPEGVLNDFQRKGNPTQKEGNNGSLER